MFILYSEEEEEEEAAAAAAKGTVRGSDVGRPAGNRPVVGRHLVAETCSCVTLKLRFKLFPPKDGDTDFRR